MRILAAADIHGNHAVYRWLADVARESHVSGIVLAGDLLGYPGLFDALEADQEADALHCFGLLKRAGVPVYYIMGNDDFIDLSPPDQTCFPLHGQRYELGEWNLVGYHHSPPFTGGPHEKPEEEIEQDLRGLAGLVDSNSVLVTHCPAAGILDRGIMGMHAGSESILRLVDLKCIRAHIHGHVHACFGRDGIHFNVAADCSCRAMLIDLAALREIVLEQPDAGI